MRGIIVASAVFLAATGVARAGFEICNDSSVRANVAIGYMGEGDWTSEGWWRIEPGDCKTVLTDELTRTRYYWRATSASGPDWPARKFMFCTAKKPFTIVGDDDCTVRSYRREGFDEIVLTKGTTGFRLRLDDEQRLAALRAEEEGVTTQDSVADVVQSMPPANETPPTPRRASKQTPAEPLGFSVSGETLTVSGAPPIGSLGEPYTVTGVFQGCEYYDVSMACLLNSGSFTYRAQSNDATPEAMLDAMIDMKTFAQQRWSGDLVAQNGGEVEVTLREVVQLDPDPHGDTRKAVQGEWIDSADPSQRLSLIGNIYSLSYGTGEPETGIFAFSERCDEPVGEGLYLNFYPDSGEASTCYAVSTASTSRLNISQMGMLQGAAYIRP